jgi:Ca2+-binding RTX toxin-like protein
MAVIASFGANTLTVFGDNDTNTTELSRNAAGQLLVDNGAVKPSGGTPTVANTSLIQAFGQGGDDVITVNEANGALPRINLFGGTGNDRLTGGSGGDMLFGQSGNDTLFGKGGDDFLFGGSENDVLTGGDGADQMFGEAGNDRMIWNPGDDSDLMEGGAGIDTAEVNGGNGAEAFTATANGTRVRFDRVNPAPFALDIGTTEHLVVNMNGGDDTFSATGNLAALIKLTVDGGDGNDTILGGNGVDLLLGGTGDDFIDGNQGNDVALLSAGNDVFNWDAGDGSDVVEGQDGFDTLKFNGSAANELFEVAANGGRVRQTRNLGSIVNDLDGMEAVHFFAGGGADGVTVGDMSGTDLSQVSIDLALAPGGTAGDAQADTVKLLGTQGADVVDVFGSGGAVSVVGLAAVVNLKGSEGANDSLIVSTLGGDDSISAATLPAGVTRLTIDAGAGDDSIVGSRGNDTMIGGDGNDRIVGGQGADLALMGAGDDVFTWNPGDGSDTVEGQDGSDTLDFNGSNAGEAISFSANGGRVRLARDIAAVNMDLDGVERTTVDLLGGADAVVVGDLGGTDLRQLQLNLAGFNGAGDASTDSVTLNATNAADTVKVTSEGGAAAVNGLAVSVAIQGAESQDRLVINGQGGNDVIDAVAFNDGQMALTINGGLGDDQLLGSAGNDLFHGGDGADVALMGAGDDVFVWNPGDDSDVVEGQAGSDTLDFSGSNVSENIDIGANGGRVRFARDVAAVTMDLNDVESIDFKALGGADNIVVRDLSGTDLHQVRIDLTGAADAGDGQVDTVTVHGTQGADAAVLFMRGADLVVSGLGTEIVIHGFDANDRLVFNGLAGNDLIDASALPAHAMQLVLHGDAGSDVLVGGLGADVLLGGEGNDVLIGGPGADVLDGGLGDNVVLQ